MTWFNILFFSVFAILFLKSFISWVISDVDVDIDFDGDTDIDVSGMLSFKGMLHFLLGFSSVLTAVGYENTHSLAIPYTFALSSYIFAVCVGIVMMVSLFYLYKFMLKLNHYTSDNPNLNNTNGKIYLIDGDGQYQVLVDTPNGTFKKTAYSENKNHKIGEDIILKWDEENKRYFFN